MAHTISRPHVRAVAATAAALAAVASVLAAPALAVPPPNDTAPRAEEIATVPATIEADTREATRDRVSRPCVFGHSVWYRYTPDETGALKLVTIGSNFDTVLAVYRGATAPRTMLACNDDAADLTSAVRPELVAGRQYWVAVSSCCGNGNGRGGDLTLRAYRGGVPGVQMTFGSAETSTVSGRLRVRGTMTCNTPSVVFGSVTVSQRVGDRVARGERSLRVRECLPEPTEWTVRIDSQTGAAFQPDSMAVEGFAAAFDGFGRVSDRVEGTLVATEGP